MRIFIIEGCVVLLFFRVWCLVVERIVSVFRFLWCVVYGDWVKDRLIIVFIWCEDMFKYVFMDVMNFMCFVD